MLSVLAVATCLRAYALHEYARQLTELAVGVLGKGGRGRRLGKRSCSLHAHAWQSLCTGMAAQSTWH